jgi:type IV pilus assembly protein PilV
MLKSVIAQGERGTTMMEVLVTILILAFGMLGLAGMQMKVHTAEMESYQRAQAVVLLSDMVERMNANRGAVTNDSYVLGTTGNSPLGTDNTVQPAWPCAGLSIAARDQCEWHHALLGVAEKSAAANVGAMIGARGCIEKIQQWTGAPSCNPGIYQVTVTWQGLNPTSAPLLGCAADKYAGQTTLRRAVSTTVSIAQTSC